ncbi:MAG: hypothetical protein JEZ05_08100 [Tenericutes bacterium]|nr:hypothetical protein [Mycoplasmatota bacterium]
MNKLYAWISKNNKWKTVIILAIIALISYVLMLTKVLGLNAHLNMALVLDTQFFYTGSYFSATLNSLTTNEVNAYLYMHLLDYVFILSFYPALCFLFDFINKQHSNIVILPLIAMLFDFLENSLIDIKLLVGIPQLFGSIAGIFTVLKFSVLIISGILMVINVFVNRKSNAKT